MRLALRIVIGLLAIAATVAAFRYGIPPKQGPATASIWWFPVAFPLFMLFGDPLIGMFFGLLQFPAMAGMVIYGLGRWPAKRVLLVAVISYLTAVALCAGVMWLIERIARQRKSAFESRTSVCCLAEERRVDGLHGRLALVEGDDDADLDLAGGDHVDVDAR